MITVLHAINPTFFVREGSEAPKHTNYRAVAFVDSNDITEAYKLTNTFETPWWENDGVRFQGSPDYGMEGCRSTSIGDVMELKGRFFQVMSAGYREIEDIVWYRAAFKAA